MTEQQAPTPLPCPFCGGIGLDFTEGSSFRWLAYSCAECGIGSETRKQTLGDGTNEEWAEAAKADAIEAWNTRAKNIDTASPSPASLQGALRSILYIARDDKRGWSDWDRVAEVCAAALATPQPSPASPAPEPLCMCKDRTLSKCPGEWEPGCDLGNNEKFSRPGAEDRKELRRKLNLEARERRAGIAGSWETHLKYEAERAQAKGAALLTDATCRDAARYRHMRASAQFQDRNGPGIYWYLPRWDRNLPVGERLDEAIDRALATSATPVPKILLDVHPARGH